MAGGDWGNQLYDRGHPLVPGIGELGCYVDSANRALPTYLVDSGRWENGGPNAPVEEKIKTVVEVMQTNECKTEENQIEMKIDSEPQVST